MSESELHPHRHDETDPEPPADAEVIPAASQSFDPTRPDVPDGLLDDEVDARGYTPIATDDEGAVIAAVLDIETVDEHAETPTYSYSQSHIGRQDVAPELQPQLHTLPDGSLFYGAPPIRALTPHELSRSTRIPTPAMRTFSRRFNALSLPEQTTARGIDDLPEQFPDEFSEGLSNTEAKHARAYTDDILTLPHPSLTWPSFLLNRTVLPAYYRLRQTDILTRVDQIDRFVDRQGPGAVWRTNPQVYVRAYGYATERTGFPCQHSGLTNYGDDWFGCSNDDCYVRYHRSVTEEVFG